MPRRPHCLLPSRIISSGMPSRAICPLRSSLCRPLQSVAKRRHPGRIRSDHPFIQPQGRTKPHSVPTHIRCARLRSEDTERGELNENAGFHFQGEPLVSTQEPEPGDEVVLRTGGPVMTVLGSADDQPRELFCVWFDEERRRCQGTFHSELLKLVE
jgi:uncharacterized protein YodC (DUF2158 family)